MLFSFLGEFITWSDYWGVEENKRRRLASGLLWGIFFFKRFTYLFFMHTSVLPAGMSVYHFLVWCLLVKLWMVVMDVSCCVDVGNSIRSSGRVTSALNHRTNSPANYGYILKNLRIS